MTLTATIDVMLVYMTCGSNLTCMHTQPSSVDKYQCVSAMQGARTYPILRLMPATWSMPSVSAPRQGQTVKLTCLVLPQQA